MESHVTSDFDTPEKAQAYAERLLEGPVNPWLHTLLVTVISGSAAAVVQALADPSALFAPGGWHRIAAAAIAGGLLALVNFLKASPVPAMKESLGVPPKDGSAR